MIELLPILDVITPEEEQGLLAFIKDENIVKNSSVKDRFLIRYGNSVYPNHIKSKIIPPYLVDLSNKLITLGILDELPASVTINVYEPGDYINPHVDNLRAGPVITILSLLSEAEIVLTKQHHKKQILLPTRSVLQLKDVYRTTWMHSIPKVKTRRISIVFRQEGKQIKK